MMSKIIPSTKVETEQSTPSPGHDSDGSSPLQELDIEQKATFEVPAGRISPDGGLLAWSVVLGAWCTSFCTFGWLNSVGIFQEYYQNDLLKSYSPSTIAWISSLQIFFMTGTGPVVGVIYDNYGPRMLILVGSILHVLGIMMMSLGTKYWQILLAQGMCSAIGVSMISQPSFIAIQGWFKKRRATAFGILFTGSSVAGVVLPIMVSRMIRQVGFGWTMRTVGFLILFLLIIANLTIRPFYPPKPQKITATQLRKPFTEVDFVLLTAGLFVFSYGFFPPITFLQVEALDAGMSPNLAQYVISILNAGSLFGRLGSGILADKIGRYNTFTVVSYLSGLFILVIWLPGTSDAATITFAILFGFVSGAFISLLTPLIMQISPMAEVGFRSGIVMFFIAVAGLTANPLNGAILEGASGWVGMKVFSGVMCLVGTTFVLAVRIRRVGWKVSAKF